MRQPNPNRRSSPSMLLKLTKERLDKHRKPLSQFPQVDGKKTRAGNESDDQLINRLLDYFEVNNKPADIGLKTYNLKQVSTISTTA